jgi:hypothetical protein
MNRVTAKRMHEATNITHWLEVPGFGDGNPVLKSLCTAVRALPFSTHEVLKKSFFDTDKVIAVFGESVVVDGAAGQVDKFMFRYPGRMSLEDFRDHVDEEVGTLTRCLPSIALSTEVSIKTARVFRSRRTHTQAVAQTQEKLDLDIHAPFDMDNVLLESASKTKDRTAKDLEVLLAGIDHLVTEHGYYPDVADNSGNLRRSVVDGSISLIDVMPVYTNGERLIADGAVILPEALANIACYQTFVGQYGA